MIIVVLSVLLLACAVLTQRMLRYRRLMKGAQHRYPGRIPQVEPGQFHPRLVDDDFGATPAAEVVFIGGSEGTIASVSDREAWILCVLAKDSPSIFEFGTASGRTTYLLARNQPEAGRVVTITLAPDAHESYKPGAGDTAASAAFALKESAFTRFRYTGTPVEARIEQLYGDSKAFDEHAHRQAYDLIFIDGAHSESYVLSDTEKALAMIRPGGIIVWHDYRFPDQPETMGVCAVLDRLLACLPLQRLTGTSFVVCRAPA